MKLSALAKVCQCGRKGTIKVYGGGLLGTSRDLGERRNGLEQAEWPPPAPKIELKSSDFIELIKSTERMSNVALRAHSEAYDLVYFHPETYEACCMAVGCVLNMVDGLMKGDIRNGLAVVRPPGHHADEDTANTYCIFNTLAIAATYARRVHGAER
ncbi:polyamine deacetylase HDAC10-like [Carcharodon carcharias]|uniref:polyamine deacetylase HDAC10-like n=1 Tax=Carcharodon carcharias TaxID=13397 RepID=UPI001B7DD1C8|nr:polyamine deacetylase HDAC10-like [Carcharodon carcharias]